MVSRKRISQQFALATVVASMLTAILGCRFNLQQPAVEPEIKPTEPEIRVKIAGPKDEIVISIDGPFVIYNQRGQILTRGARLSRVFVGFHNTFLQIGARRFEVSGFCDIVPKRNGTLSLDHRYYRGSLRVYKTDSGQIIAVNHVRIEDYLRGVLPSELPGRFRYETYKAQAIAARTFALYEKVTSHSRKKWDVLATESSQVYRGKSVETAKASRAVRATRGIVLTAKRPNGWKIFPTYYSSTCGGWTQPAWNLAHIDKSIKPLAGNVRCSTCRISRYYNWYDRKVTRQELTDSLNKKLAGRVKFDLISEIRILKRTRHGRIAKIEVVDQSGKTIKLSGERFRLIVGSRKMPSTDCNIRTTEDGFVFTDGHGLGHGVGMCQYGAEGLARQGRTALEILQHYYPGSKPVKAY